MANKFLPFVVEKSTPLHIFETLLSRSKGMNTSLIASVFNVVLKVGIGELRQFVKTLPDMPLDTVYEEVVQRHSNHRVSDTDIKFFQGLGNYFTEKEHDHIVAELREHEFNDVMLFFVVLAMNDEPNHPIDEYTNIPFVKIQKQMVDVLKNLPDHVPFSDTGEVKEFKDAYDLQAFIIYSALICETSLTPVRAVFRKSRSSA